MLASTVVLAKINRPQSGGLVPRLLNLIRQLYEASPIFWEISLACPGKTSWGNQLSGYNRAASDLAGAEHRSRNALADRPGPVRHHGDNQRQCRGICSGKAARLCGEMTKCTLIARLLSLCVS